MIKTFAIALGLVLAGIELLLIRQFARSTKSGTKSMVIFAICSFTFPFAAVAIAAILWTTMILWYGTAFAFTLFIGGFVLYLIYKRGETNK